MNSMSNILFFVVLVIAPHLLTIIERNTNHNIIMGASTSKLCVVVVKKRVQRA